ncbi:MAG: hypothetical protein WKG07_11560 [Hymenobacter sp.]
MGPFARLRPGAVLDGGVHVGNFVEVKNSHLASGVRRATWLTWATPPSGRRATSGPEPSPPTSTAWASTAPRSARASSSAATPP